MKLLIMNSERFQSLYLHSLYTVQRHQTVRDFRFLNKWFALRLPFCRRNVLIQTLVYILL